MGSRGPRVTKARKGRGGPQELGASQVPEEMMALVAPQGHLVVLVPRDLKGFRVRRVSEVPLERVWWGLPVLLAPLVREGNRGDPDLPAPAGRKEKLH